MSAHCLYILFSATSYRMGRWIRFATGEPYNHVSIATDSSLRKLYSFARHYYHTPFYGGFVTEHPCRFYHNDVPADILLCRIPLSIHQKKRLDALLEAMQRQPSHYLYNHLSILTALMHHKVQVEDAYTCAEFAVTVLSELGLPFDPAQFYTIDQILHKLEEYRIYSGPFPAEADTDPDYFCRDNAPHPLLISTKAFAHLCFRAATGNIRAFCQNSRRLFIR